MATDVERLLREHEPALRAALRAYLGSAADVDDVAQETMLSVLQDPGRIDADRNPRAWLLKVAVNKARDFLRRRAVRKSAAADLDAIPAVAPAADLDVERVRAAFRVLPEQVRLILHLAYYEDLPYAEIADVLGMSLSAVKMAVARGRDRMRRALGGERP